MSPRDSCCSRASTYKMMDGSRATLEQGWRGNVLLINGAAQWQLSVPMRKGSVILCAIPVRSTCLPSPAGDMIWYHLISDWIQPIWYHMTLDWSGSILYQTISDLGWTWSDIIWYQIDVITWYQIDLISRDIRSDGLNLTSHYQIESEQFDNMWYCVI